MCVAPDVVYVPKAELESFLELAKAFFDQTNPNYTAGNDSTGIITDRHLSRLVGMLAEARESGARVVDMEPGVSVDKATRKMPLSLVVDPAEHLLVSREESFGLVTGLRLTCTALLMSCCLCSPILSVVPYTDLEIVLAKINAGERPLGLYIFSQDRPTIDHIIRNTKSGGVSVNACAAHGAVYSMGFGGVGSSGMGRHQGFAGFCEFSNPKGIFERSEGEDGMVAWRPRACIRCLV